VELITRLPQLEKLYLNSNRLTVLPPELGELKSLKVLRVDNNMLVSVPGKFKLNLNCFNIQERKLKVRNKIGVQKKIM
jgi:Leucine-rich repeat (LRR) protein